MWTPFSPATISPLDAAAHRFRLLCSVQTKLPGGDRAIVDIAKVRDYRLNPAHPRGRHKPRVFASALGLRAADAEFLCGKLLRPRNEAIPGDADETRRAIYRRFQTRLQRPARGRPQCMDRQQGRRRSASNQLFCIIERRIAMAEIEMLSVVALLEDIPQRGLLR
jgi:hypothetical protein